MKKVFGFMISVIAFVFIFSGAVWLTLNFKPLYLLDEKLYGLSDVSGMSHEEIMANYDTLIEYNNFWGEEKLRFPTLAMSAEGEIHFAQVRDIFISLEWAAIISGAVSVLGLALLRDIRALRLTGIMAVVFPILAGGTFALFWDRMFVLFHKIFFANDFWIFDPVTDPVILILPDGFFLHCVLMIAAVILLAGAVCLFVSKTKHD